MSDDDLKLLFETERRILARRLKKLFPSGSPYSTTKSKESRGTKPEAFPKRSGSSASSDSNHSGRKPLVRRRRPLTEIVVSVGLHALLLAILLPMVIAHRPEEASKDFTVRWVPRQAARSEAPRPDAQQQKPEPIPATEKPEPQVSVPVETPPAPAEPAPEPTPESEPPVENTQLHGIAGAPPGADDGKAASGPYSSRSSGKAVALQRYGGSEATENAVEAGLRWLVTHQDKDGSWSPDGFHRHCPGKACRGGGFPEYRVGVTGLALLGLLASGFTGDAEDSASRALSSGLDYLILVQDEAGCFGPRTGNYMYNHAIATLCIAEAAAITGHEELRSAAARGLRFSADTQQPGGGWDYTSARTLRNDLSITGWQVMAMYTARSANIFYRPEMETKVRRFIKRACPASGWAVYSDRGVGAGRGGVSIAAVGMLCKLYLGWSPRSAEIQRTAKILIRRPPDDGKRVDWEKTFQSSYYWYYATLALFHQGGEIWDAWNVFVQRTILPLQRTRDHREGSWDPDPNWLGAAGGRVATTALNLLTLEVYYRFAPLAKKFGAEAEKSEEKK